MEWRYEIERLLNTLGMDFKQSNWNCILEKELSRRKK